MGRMASSDCMGAVHRRRDSHSARLLQDPPWLDNGPAPGRQIRKIPRLEPDLRFILKKAVN